MSSNAHLGSFRPFTLGLQRRLRWRGAREEDAKADARSTGFGAPLPFPWPRRNEEPAVFATGRRRVNAPSRRPGVTSSRDSRTPFARRARASTGAGRGAREKNSQATGRGRCTHGLGFDLLLRIKAAVRADVATPGGALLPRSLDPPRRCPTLGNSAESQTAATRCRAAEWPGNFSFMIRAEPGSRKNWPSAVSIVRDVVKARGVGGGSSRPSPVTRAPLVQSSEGGPGNSAERGHESLRRRSEELATARRWPRRRQKTKRGKRKTGRGAWGFPGLGSAFGPTRRRRARPVPATSCPFSPVQLSSFTIAGVLRV